MRKRVDWDNLRRFSDSASTPADESIGDGQATKYAILLVRFNVLWLFFV